VAPLSAACAHRELGGSRARACCGPGAAGDAATEASTDTGALILCLLRPASKTTPGALARSHATVASSSSPFAHRLQRVIPARCGDDLADEITRCRSA
jgi:hypothetical protein